MATMHFLLNWNHCVKSYGHFCQILALLAIPAHQIWSCHVTQNFENLLFFPYPIFNIRKGHKISTGKALYFRSYQQKTSPGGGGWKTPVLLGLNVYTFFTLMVYGFKVTSHYFRQYHPLIR